MLVDVQRLLLNFEIYSIINKKNGRYNGRHHLSYRLTIGGDGSDRNYIENIGFCGAKSKLLPLVLDKKINSTSILSNLPPEWRKFIDIPKYHIRKHGIRIDNKYRTSLQKAQAVAEFVGNEAGDNGGAIAVGGATGSTALFEDCTFRDNQAGDDGGAFFVVNFARDGGFASFRNNTLTGNTAGRDGGAVHNQQWLLENGGRVLFNDN